MGLLGEIQKHAPKKGPGCLMAAVEKELSPKDHADLKQALADTSIASTAIFRALKARGHAVHEDGIRRHRKNECACAGS